MLKKRFRGLLRGDFADLKDKGRRIYTTWLMASVLEADRLGVGVIISRKVSTRAVDRNRLKRLIIKGLEKKLVNRKIKLVIIPKQNILRVAGVDIRQEVEVLTTKL